MHELFVPIKTQQIRKIFRALTLLYRKLGSKVISWKWRCIRNYITPLCTIYIRDVSCVSRSRNVFTRSPALCLIIISIIILCICCSPPTHCTVGDDSTGGAWIQEFHDFAKSKIAVKFIKSLPQIIRSWIKNGAKIKCS